MYCLEDKEKRFILFVNYRVASRSLEAWFNFTQGIENPARLGNPYSKASEEGAKKIIVVRNPIDRFVSNTNHPAVFNYDNSKYRDKEERINHLLDILEGDRDVDQHFHAQSVFDDSPDFHKSNDVSKLFSNVLKIEDGSLVPRLNEIVGLESDDFFLNTTLSKQSNPVFNRHGFDYTGIDFVTKEDLTEEQINRIKEIYKYDFLYFYPL